MQKNTKKEVFSWVIVIAFALSIAFIVRAFVFTPVAVTGQSMEPTFDHKDKLVVSKLGNTDRFDIVVFDAPDKDEKYIKRVIGLPGDRVEMKDNQLSVNGEIYDEPYLKDNENTDDFTLEELTGEETVPEDYLFVLGDNRSNSKDSRVLGFISADSVIGEAKFQFYPFDEIGITK